MHGLGGHFLDALSKQLQKVLQTVSGELFHEEQMDEMPEPRLLSSILTYHADIPSAPTLMTECQGRFGALASPALDCCGEFVCATLMYGDSDLSLTSTPLVDDDLLPVSSMPPLPVPKRMVTGAQRSSVDGGVVAVHVRTVECRFRA